METANNLAERLLRWTVLWRKRSMGMESKSGDRWVERILTLIQTWRLQNRLLYLVLVKAIESHMHETDFDLSWISKSYEKDGEHVTP